ncbi:flagellar motor switch protein FliG [Fluviispira multicolorata]|uniref:flagellar motor switch protein FliG n=1 Tax=Fluviispira multicolorata TaxID=2654512 RepID=UPI001375A1F6|nr:flagellar motor switch protein FliG [Fluviispira multicolorata]
MAIKYSGPQKAAILLLAFGEEISAEIFKHMTEFEIKRIGSAMSRLGRVDSDAIDMVMEEFYHILQSNKKYFLGSNDFTRKLIESAFKSDQANALIDELSLTSNANLESLELIDPKMLANFLRNEHPQTMALILAHLDPKKFGETLKILPESLHTELILRVASLESVSPEIIDEIDDVLRNEIQKLGNVTSSKVGGIEPIVEMLNLMDKATEENILDRLEERDPDLAENIRKLMFVFDDLIKIDDRGIQTVMREVKPEQLKLALKTASEGVKELIFKNMSQKAAENLREEMTIMGPAKISDVEQAQFAIVQVARRLNDEGKIVISASGENALV